MGPPPPDNGVTEPSQNPGPVKWSQVVGRKAKRAERGERVFRPATSSLAQSKGVTSAKRAAKNKKGTRANPRKKRRAAASPPFISRCGGDDSRGEGQYYSEVIREARQGVSLEALGITKSGVKSSRNGGLLIEIPGKGRVAKTEALSQRLRDLFRERGNQIKITVPKRCAEIGVRGLDRSDPRRRCPGNRQGGWVQRG